MWRGEREDLYTHCWTKRGTHSICATLICSAKQDRPMLCHPRRILFNPFGWTICPTHSTWQDKNDDYVLLHRLTLWDSSSSDIFPFIFDLVGESDIVVDDERNPIDFGWTTERSARSLSSGQIKRSRRDRKKNRRTREKKKKKSDDEISLH